MGVLIKDLYKLLLTRHQKLQLRMLSKSILLGIVACSIIAICYSLPQLPRSEIEGKHEEKAGYKIIGKRDVDQEEPEGRGYRGYTGKGGYPRTGGHLAKADARKAGAGKGPVYTRGGQDEAE